MKLNNELRVAIDGHLLIREYENREDVGDSSKGRELLNKRNAIHKEHMSIALARALGNRENGSVFTMHFGTGGATIDPLGDIIHANPNVTGSADLNNPVYFEVVDDNEGAPPGNQMAVRHINGTLFSDLEIRCVIDRNEPFGQAATDNVGNTNINSSQFVFDEIGIATQDHMLLTHVVFSPIEKSANRVIEIVYTLRISIVE